jgi:CO/xanthine dehydrogenase FAD-binding subunit
VSGDCVIPLSDLVGGEQLEVTRSYFADSDMSDPVTGSGNTAHSYSFAAQVAEVAVDERSGEIKVLRIFSAHDSGAVLNPLKFEGQVTGGIAMGLGAALSEELVYEGGRLVNPAYVNYGLPRAADVPEIRVISVGAPEPTGPYGAKGVGEIGLQPLPAAIANAVAHAVGVRLRDLPLTPDKVLEAIRARDGVPSRSFNLWRRPGRWYIAGMRAAYPYGLHHVLHRWGTRLARRSGNPTSTVSRVTAPLTLHDAVHELAADEQATPLAGGTDLLPALDQGIAAPRTLVDLRLVPGLSGIRTSTSGTLRIGAGVTLSDLLDHAEGQGDAVIAEALRTIATPQVRAVATVGGNLCQEKRCWFFRNGFDCYKRGGWTCPCYAVQGDHRFQHAVVDGHRCQAVTPSDLATVFAALDAVVHIAGSKRDRVVPLPELYSGPGEVALAQGEVVSAVELPASARARISRFEKQRLFDGDFAIVSACASLELDDGGAVVDSRIVLGAVAPIPFRAEAVERALRGTVLRPDGIRAAAQAWVGAAHPLERNAWKVDAASAAVERALLRCIPGRGGVPLSGTRGL